MHLKKNFFFFLVNSKQPEKPWRAWLFELCVILRQATVHVNLTRLYDSHWEQHSRSFDFYSLQSPWIVVVFSTLKRRSPSFYISGITLEIRCSRWTQWSFISLMMHSFTNAWQQKATRCEKIMQKACQIINLIVSISSIHHSNLNAKKRIQYKERDRCPS